MKSWYEHLSQEQLYTLFSLYTNRNTTEYIAKLSVIIKVLIELLEVQESVPARAAEAPDYSTESEEAFHQKMLAEARRDMQRMQQEMKSSYTNTAVETPQRYKRG